MPRLSMRTVGSLGPDIQVPAYDRSEVRPGIVHLGAGAFHRAHQAVFIDDCLARGFHDWGIVAVSLRHPEARDRLLPQDCLYSVAFRDGDSARIRVIGSILEVIVAPEAPRRLLRTLADPAIRLVTLTITEKGYAIDPATGSLDRSDPSVLGDLADPDNPSTALGYLARSIDLRRQAGLAPFTVLS
eukprot:gene33333-44618_t